MIGAGSSGIAVVKALWDAGIPFACYERGDRVGGNWVFKNTNGMSSAYRSLHINTSRDRMQYADYPMPRDYPQFPHHTLIARYFDDYVDHFGFRHKIEFGRTVERVTPRDGGGYVVLLDGGQREEFEAVIVANGHHWDPLWPTPPFAGEFDGVQAHSHYYIDPDEPDELRGKRVVVVGMGNSAMDIACELSQPGVAAKVFLAARRGAWIVPHYLLGRPLDQALKLPKWMPFSVKRTIAKSVLRLHVGRVEDYGLPTPDHPIGSAHPTISSEILPRLGRGDVIPKPNIKQLRGDAVQFEDGSVEHVDAILYCTGYKVSFPFFDEDFLAAKDNKLRLYRRVFLPDRRDLFFVGLCQPLGAIMPIAEAQGKWIADYLIGDYELPSDSEIERDIAAEVQALEARYVRSPRHTMQVDFDDYMDELAAEMRAGRKRARRSA